MADSAVWACSAGFVVVVVYVALRLSGLRHVGARVLRDPLAMSVGLGVLGLIGVGALSRGQVGGLLPAVLAGAFVASVVHAATAPFVVQPTRPDRH